MTQVNPGDSLTALMRVQIDAIRKRTKPSVQSRNRPVQAAPVPHGGTSDLAAAAARRIRQISADDPEKESKAARIFLESVLLAELGPSLIDDPQFSRMVDHVQEQMASNPELAQATAQAAALLLKTAAQT